jgi:hypothetical protein
MTHQTRRARVIFAIFATVSTLAACSSKSPSHSSVKASAAANADYSILRTGNRYASDVGDAYLDQVQPVIASRCAVCHSCTNGPCQLNMTSYAALERGVNSTNPYKWGLFDSYPTRVADNRPLSEWRGRGFRTVLPENGVSPDDSVFLQALEFGEQNYSAPTPDQGPLSLPTVRALAQAQDNGDYVCPASTAEYVNLKMKYPQGGMPWGLPALDAPRHATLENWVRAGAQGPAAAAEQTVSNPQVTVMTQVDPNTVIASWEAFFNGDDLRSQLVARYLYEHSYSANIQLAENPGEFYRIVRSHTVAPAPIDAIITDEPQDDPQAARVYYRMQKIDRVIEGKVHVPWEISLNDLDHLKSLFLAPGWDVTTLPDYSDRNPFDTFAAIPAAVRSRFMIENSRMLFAQFARGPICLVQIASWAVDEYFWIWFLKPESDPSVLQPRLGLDSYATFFSKDGNLVSGVPVLGDKYGEPTYRAAFESTLRKLKPAGLGASDVWTGDGSNANAWLTVHRHQVSVDVHTTQDRPITGLPKSVWLMSYANFERMYYNAVAQYKYWGSLKHQNDTFNWQIYTRTEAEDLYASLFPDQSYRDSLRNRFTSFQGKLYNKLFTDYAWGRPSTSPDLKTEDQLARALMTSMAPVLGPEDRLNHWPNDSYPSTVPATVATPADFEAALRTLTNREAPFAQFLPNVVHVRLGGDQLYTLLAVRSYREDKISTGEAAARTREHDIMVAIPGLTAYEAHLFVDLPYNRAAAFVSELGAVTDLNSWNAFSARYKIGRNSPDFWPFVDWLHHWQEQNIPLRAGLLELRVYDKDEKPF